MDPLADEFDFDMVFNLSPSPMVNKLSSANLSSEEEHEIVREDDYLTSSRMNVEPEVLAISFKSHSFAHKPTPSTLSTSGGGGLSISIEDVPVGEEKKGPSSPQSNKNSIRLDDSDISDYEDEEEEEDVEVSGEKREEGEGDLKEEERGEEEGESEREGGEKKKRKHQRSDYDIISMVGKGGFGSVYQVRHIKTNKIYAMKVLKKSFLIETDNASYTRQERDVLTSVTHPFIVQLHAAFQTVSRVCLVMNFVNGGQLFWHMRKAAMFSEKIVKFYVAEISVALHFLHSKGIIHRDLKPENILLAADGHVCLTDFGFAKETGDGHTGTWCGTTEYMAPEIIHKKKYTFPADWWSLGAVTYDMLSGKPPFQHSNETKLHQLILKGKVRYPKYFSPESIALMKGLLNLNPDKRVGKNVRDFRQLRWFKDIHWKKLVEKESEPPFVPKVPKGDLDVSLFDKKYTATPVPESPDVVAQTLSESQEKCFHGFSYVRTPTSPDGFPFSSSSSPSIYSSSLTSGLAPNQSEMYLKETKLHEADGSNCDPSKTTLLADALTQEKKEKKNEV